MNNDLIQAATSPLAKTLLLSLSLHWAVIMLIQPEPGQGHPQVSIIQARLNLPEPDPAPVEPRLEEVPSLEPVTLDEPGEAIVAPPQNVAPDAPPVESTNPTLPEPKVEPDQERDEVSAPGEDAPALAEAVTDMAGRADPTGAEALATVPVMVDTRWYTARELDVQPRAGRPIAPDYPEDARLEGVAGHVVLSMRIDEFGQVKDVTVESAEPAGVFDESALAAFRQARFFPARLAGRPVRSEIRIRVTYALED